ncbi:hypothetical protein ACIPNH_05080, partial [Wolbachia endosymbiont of Drosophila barbarae]|uniref:hypothetical protein n=1 Tax=Wolbachia endosymbiont of Drosophila barbarae TaxID=3377043 RepID=UPI00382D2A79
MIVGRKVLEHDPEKVCENKNIHADHKEHEDNGSIKKYEEKENKFIEEAREYLLKRGFNSNFKLKGYYESSIAFLIIVRTGHRKAESTARRKD